MGDQRRPSFRIRRQCRIAFAFAMLTPPVHATDTRNSSAAPRGVPCTELVVSAAPGVTGRRFLALGTDHRTNVFTPVTEALEATNPDIVSLEHRLTIWNIGAFHTGEQMKALQRELLAGRLRYAVAIEGQTVRVTTGGVPIFNSESGDFSEAAAGIAYAVRTGKPFYFTDWSNDFPYTMFRFHEGRVTPVSIAVRSPRPRVDGEPPAADGSPAVHLMDVRTRNRLTADGIAQLYDDYGSIVHLGGTYHFNGVSGRGHRLQDLIPAENVEARQLAGGGF